MTTSDAGLVAERFRVLGLLGTGGTAVVYRARDDVTGQVVALKLSHPHAEPARLHGEAYALSRIDHPNVVRMLGSGDLPDGRSWIALELVDGVSLAERVGREGPLDPAAALEVAVGLLDALAAMHAVGLVHRDVSPLNVHIAPGPIRAAGVRLLDLGLAGAEGTAAVFDEPGVLGNPGYVSPEQSRGEPVDARGDLYQAGATLYLALTGHPPFGEGPAERLVVAHRTSPPPVPSVARPGLPNALDQLVVRAMLKEPGLRYVSAVQMRDAVLDVADAPARPPGTRELPVVVIHAPPVVGVPADVLVGLAPTQSRPVESPPPSSTAVRSTRGAAVIAVLVVLAAIGGMGWAAQVLPGPVEASPSALATTTTPTATPTPPRPSAAGRHTPTAAPLVVVPEVTGLGVAEAVAALEAVGLRAGTLSSVPALLAAGTVLGSSPAAGAAAAPGSAVDLQSASGTTLVPDVRGMTSVAAEQVLRAAGLVPEARGTGTAGVLASSPVAQTELPLGATVTLDLGDEAAPEPSPSPTPTPTPTPSLIG